MSTTYCGDCEPSCRGHSSHADPRPPDTKTFADPHRYATFLLNRGPSFKTHSTLRAAKGALSVYANTLPSRQREMRIHGYVYEFNFETGMWDEIAHLPKGAILEMDPWYSVSQKKSKAIIGPSQSAVDKAIASIVGST